MKIIKGFAINEESYRGDALSQNVALESNNTNGLQIVHPTFSAHMNELFEVVNTTKMLRLRRVPVSDFFIFKNMFPFFHFSSLLFSLFKRYQILIFYNQIIVNIPVYLQKNNALFSSLSGQLWYNGHLYRS